MQVPDEILYDEDIQRFLAEQYKSGSILDLPLPAPKPKLDLIEIEITRGMVTSTRDSRYGREALPTGYNYNEGRPLLDPRPLPCPMMMPAAPGFPIPPLLARPAGGPLPF